MKPSWMQERFWPDTADPRPQVTTYERGSPRDMVRASAYVEPCRWATPDDQGYCKRCGWPTIRVSASSSRAGYTKHKRLPGYPHQRRTKLLLSEASKRAERGTLRSVAHDGHNPPGSEAFAQRTGAGSRIVLPTATELHALKRRVRELVERSDATIEVPLTMGYTAIIDAEDRHLVENYNWFANRRDHTVYALTNVPAPGRRRPQTPLHMHRLVMGLNRGDPRQVDHINSNGLDNRKVNLRIVTPHQNQMHKRAQLGSTSRFVGVSRMNGCDRWRVSVGKRYIGLFTDEVQAARARDAVALEMYGEYAELNFPKGVPS